MRDYHRGMRKQLTNEKTAYNCRMLKSIGAINSCHMVLSSYSFNLYGFSFQRKQYTINNMNNFS